jgi:hypothetical protein
MKDCCGQGFAFSLLMVLPGLGFFGPFVVVHFGGYRGLLVPSSGTAWSGSGSRGSHLVSVFFRSGWSNSGGEARNKQ